MLPCRASDFSIVSDSRRIVRVRVQKVHLLTHTLLHYNISLRLPTVRVIGSDQVYLNFFKKTCFWQIIIIVIFTFRMHMLTYALRKRYKSNQEIDQIRTLGPKIRRISVDIRRISGYLPINVYLDIKYTRQTIQPGRFKYVLIFAFCSQPPTDTFLNKVNIFIASLRSDNFPT